MNLIQSLLNLFSGLVVTKITKHLKKSNAVVTR